MRAREKEPTRELPIVYTVVVPNERRREKARARVSNDEHSTAQHSIAPVQRIVFLTFSRFYTQPHAQRASFIRAPKTHTSPH